MSRATDTCGIFFHQFDSNDKIKDIYCLRQLSHDEQESKVLRSLQLCSSTLSLESPHHREDTYFSRFCEVSMTLPSSLGSCCP